MISNNANPVLILVIMPLLLWKRVKGYEVVCQPYSNMFEDVYSEPLNNLTTTDGRVADHALLS